MAGRLFGGLLLLTGACGRLGPAPVERVPKPLFERDNRRIAEQPVRLVDIRLGILDVPDSCFLVDRSQAAADNPAHDIEQLIEGNTARGGDVDHFAGGVCRLAGAQHAVHDVGDVGEVAGLLTVALNRRRTAFEQRRGEQRDDARIGRPRILARPEYVEIADRDGLEAIELREHLAVLLGDQLLQRIGR
jgi:hypothetical protein